MPETTTIEGGSAGNELIEGAREIAASYLKNYNTRLRHASERPVFRAEGQSAMLALAYQWLAERHSVAQRSSDLAAIDTLTRRLLDSGSKHSAAIDTTGYVWASGYGTLPLVEPPLPQIEWVYLSGSGPGAVAGVLGSAWRALFLASAWPFLNYQHRNRATVELDRRVAYLVERAGLLLEPPEGPPRLSQIAQGAFVIGELAQQLDDDVLSAINKTLLSFLLSQQRADGSLVSEPDGDVPAPTGQVAQFILACQFADAVAARDAAVRFLLDQRVSTDRNLLVRDDAEGSPLELSPWVTLAMLSLDRGVRRVNARPGAGRR